MDTREMLAIVGVTLAVITAYSLARDLTDEPLGLHAPQTGLMHMQAQVSAPHR
ncbi:MAG: hypothetical protein QM625_22440 [Ralstonia sp.]|uniref:Uncharacterized protein n=1 Tax=Ralstonia pickettii TaxID=329 RepID=A0AAW4PZH9_RALPI|nr:hypothetical protein [Ralstonia pickettii]MBX3752346.1 hypothetical protein [Ralstonia pickettii]MBX3769476.1 hypothetical protein [Ralstonia pickettii]MBX3776547.1 hypothetical protein [Ralstonia pickettii]MBX3781496.1 hypothetical protein [Ralstonia pickettii]MBX3786561.1 hypothetical protein [Ralstonia pickettii]